MNLTFNDKSKRVHGISDEVNELHPLLKTLLPRLPDVNSVDYNHGSVEYGADFILSKTDTTLGTTIYCAIIAKIGKIYKANYAKLESQIKECNIDKLIRRGKKKIQIDEVWVITTGSISGNVKVNIHKDFSTTKVQFIDCDLLINLIDNNFPDYWTDLDVEVADFLNNQLVELNEIDNSLSILPEFSKEIFIEPDIKELDRDHYKDPFVSRKRVSDTKSVDILEIISSNNMLFLEGDAGVGKSKFLRELCRKLCSKTNFPKYKILPLYLSFKQFYLNYNCDIGKLIDEQLSPYCAAAVKDGKYRILFIADAFDEINEENEDMLAKLIIFLKTVSTETKHIALIASRHLDRTTIDNIDFSNVKRLEIQPLNQQKIIQLLKALTFNVLRNQRIIEDVKTSNLFKILPRSPIAVILLAHLLNQNKTELPSTLPELYSKFIEIAVGRWEMDKGLQSEREYLALDKILGDLSAYIINNDIEGLSTNEAKGFFERYLAKRNLGINPDDLFTKATHRCPIIGTLDSGFTFKFKHRTFAEFYYAKKLIDSESILSDDKIYMPYWSNIFYFYLGLKKDCPKMLTKAIEIEVNDEFGRWFKFLKLPDYLLAAYATEFDIIKVGIKRGALDAALFIKETLRNSDKSLFSFLPEVHLLWLVQYFFKLRYAYEFFESAFADVALDIGSSNIDDELKSYALFLLDVTNNKIGGKQDFHFLLEDKYVEDQQIPLSVRIGILNESDRWKRNRFIRKIDQRLKKDLKRRGRLRNEIRRMFEVPIKKSTSSKEGN